MPELPNSLQIQWVSIAAVKPYERRAREHNKQKIEKLKKSIDHFGQVVPIIVDPEYTIIDGHACWEAVRERGAGEIAVIVISGRSDAEVKALRLALNRIPTEAAWNTPALRAEFEDLLNLSFDLDLTGFEAVEIDHVLELDLPQANIQEDLDQIPAVQPVAVTSMGDIWVCGDNRIGCGDARDQSFVDTVRAGMAADVCFTDPPYNVKISGFVSGNGRTQHREFVQASGEMTSEEFTTFVASSLAVLKSSCATGALIYASIDWRNVYELMDAGRRTDLALLNLCVWAKTNAGMGSLYRSQHELICVFKADAARHINNVELGRHGRNRSNLWSYRGLNSFGSGRDELLAAHPTVKPVAMIVDALRDVTKRGDTVLDTFIGSGSTLMAAEECGRRCFGSDLDPLYVDVAIRRWQKLTQRDAVHAETGELFEERAKRLTSEHAGGRRDG